MQNTFLELEGFIHMILKSQFKDDHLNMILESKSKGPY